MATEKKLRTSPSSKAAKQKKLVKNFDSLRSGFKNTFLKPLLAAPRMARSEAEVIAEASGATRSPRPSSRGRSLERFKNGQEPIFETGSKPKHAPSAHTPSAHSILSIAYPDGKMVLELLREAAG